MIQLSERMGQEGVRLHLLARGAFERSLVLARPSIFQEEMELDDAVVERNRSALCLGGCSINCANDWRRDRSLARTIAMEFELERSFEKELQIATHPGQQKLIPRLFEKKLALPEMPMRDSKLLLKLVRLRLQSGFAAGCGRKNHDVRGSGIARARRSADCFSPPRRSLKSWNSPWRGWPTWWVTGMSVHRN